MAKSSRTGENRARRPADRRGAAQPQESVTPEVTPTTVRDRAATRAAPPATRKSRPTREEIARRAYELYVARGGTPGSDIEDWLKAERELRGR